MNYGQLGISCIKSEESRNIKILKDDSKKLLEKTLRYITRIHNKI